MTAGLLGTSDYVAQITESGGGKALGEMPWTTIGYGRNANATSEATVTWLQGDARIPAFLIEAEPWQHDLVIWRVREPEPVFAGPIRTCSYKKQVQIKARDVTAWLEKRHIRSDTEYPDVDLAYIFAKIGAEAMSEDPTPGLDFIAAACGIRGTRVTRAAEAARAADLLRELARSGVDWTVVGRQVLIGGAGLTDPLGTLKLIDEHVIDPGLEKAGESTVTRQIIRWQTANSQAPMLTTVTAPEADTIGLLEDLDEEGDIADATSAGAAAAARLDLRANNPRAVDATLTSQAPTTVNQLIPGRRVDYRVSNLAVMAVGVTRLQKVRVNVTQNGEAVSLDTTPLGVVA